MFAGHRHTPLEGKITTPPCGPTTLGRWGLVCLGLWLGVAALALPAQAVDNGGLGPLDIRNEFPPGMPFLSFTPQRPLTLAAGRTDMDYQYSVANTFINTQSPAHTSTNVITATQVRNGLTLANFPTQGYAAYIDTEMVRHRVTLRHGLSSFLEVGLETAWLTFHGGGLDPRIESAETPFGALNQDRTYSDRNRFDYYVVHNGAFLAATSTPVDKLPADPVFSVKLGLGQGGDVLPAMSLFLTYKMPLDANPKHGRELVSSGHPDHGYYLLVGKAIGGVVFHYQVGHTVLGNPGQHYQTRLYEQMLGVEFRTSEKNSMLLQLKTRSNLFQEDYSTPSPGNKLFISRPTDVLVLGWRRQGPIFRFDLGLVEDYNQTQNETDIVFFSSLGWRW